MSSRWRSLALGLVLLAGFGLAAWLILQPPPTPQRSGQAAETPTVTVLDATPASHAVRIHAWGRTSDEEALELRPQVGGRLLRLHPQLVPGGEVPAGEVLAEIDPADEALAVRAARAELRKAEARLAIEGARRKVAHKELLQLQKDRELDAKSRALVLREPQLREARAAVEAARTALEKARLRLERTRLRLPFAVRVLARERKAGELVRAGERIARLLPVARLPVYLEAPPAALQRLQTAVTERRRIEIRHQGRRYPARLQALLPALDAKSRLLRLRALVERPFAARPPLLAGAYVEAVIPAGTLEDAVAVPRELLQNNDRVWVVDAEDRLRVRRVKVRFEEPGRLFIDPLPAGDRLLRGNPGGLVPGTRVQVREAP